MAKEAGLGITTLSVDNSAGSLKALVNDVTNFEYSTPRAVQDVTGVDKSAIERLHLLADAAVTLNGVFNDAADQAHPTLSTISTIRTVTLVVSGQTLSMEMFITDYQISRPQTGELTWQCPLVLGNGTVPTWS